MAWDSTRHELVFVEVKYRQSDLAAEAVTPWKKYKVMKTIHFYVAQQKYEGAYRWCVLAIEAGKIHWIDEVL